MSESVTGNASSDILRIGLLNFSGFNSMCNITAARQNNTLQIRTQYYTYLSTTLRSITTTIVIPDGNYSVVSLLDKLNTLVPTYDDDGNLLTFGVSGSTTYPVFTIDDNTSLISINQYVANLQQSTALASNTHIYSSFALLTNSTTIGLMKVLGFIQDNLHVTSGPDFTFQTNAAASGSNTIYQVYGNDIANSSTVGSLESSSLMSLRNLQTVNVCLEDDLCQNIAGYEDLRPSDLLASIPVTASYGDAITWNETEPNFVEISDPNITQFRVVLKDEDGVPIDFRGINWSLTLVTKWGFDDSRPGNDPRQLNMAPMMMAPVDGTGLVPTSNIQYNHITGRAIPLEHLSVTHVNPTRKRTLGGVTKKAFN